MPLRVLRVGRGVRGRAAAAPENPAANSKPCKPQAPGFWVQGLGIVGLGLCGARKLHASPVMHHGRKVENLLELGMVIGGGLTIVLVANAVGALGSTGMPVERPRKPQLG